MTRDVAEISRLGFFKPAISPEWILAPISFLKYPLATFGFTMDYCPVNGATITTSWPMLNTESELAHTRGATCFAMIDFYSGIWQEPLHHSSHPLCTFMTPFGVYIRTRTTHKRCNLAVNV